MASSGLKETSKKAPAPRAELENGHGNGQFSRRHRVSHIKEQRAPFRFEYEDEPYEGVFNRAALTIGFSHRLTELETDGGENRLIFILSALLLDWDLVQDDGETPLPFSVEELEKLPTAFLVAMVNAIWEAFSPNLPAPSETP